MPAAGNHENELGNGPYGFGAYQTRFFLPDNHEQVTLRGLWYAFTVGSVRVISINNDDVCYQDAGDSYIRGYRIRPACTASPTRRAGGGASLLGQFP